MLDHKRDAARAEDALVLSYGSELIGMQRDWNEELQSCREFPHTTPQERYRIIFCALQSMIKLYHFKHLCHVIIVFFTTEIVFSQNFTG